MHQLKRQLAFLTSHPLTRDRPLAAVARFLRWQVKSRLFKENEVHWIEGSKLLVRRGMTGATGNIYCGLHEFADMSFLLHFLRTGDLFGDVGANIGSYTILASAVCGADVVAVEPDPETAARLHLNIELNGQRAKIEVAETAVGDRVGSIRFTVGRDTMNKVSNEEADTLSRLVPMTTLDTLFKDRDPIMLKLDVEGFEGPVLCGAKRLLSNDSLLVVQSESREPAVLNLMHQEGFEEVHYNPFSRSLTDSVSIAHSNGLFIRDRTVVERRLSTARKVRVLNHSL